MSTDVSKYLLLDRLAVGGMAEVYRAKSLGVEGFEKIIAIKRILPSLAQDEDFVSMFIEEAKIAGQLSHANIAPIYELGKIDGTHFIAMEYVWGKDLLQIIERHRRMRRAVAPNMAAWIASRMLEGLDYAHRKRGADGRPLALIHRDVSPQNIIVSYDGLVKIIDFGIAKAASRATQTQAGIVKGKLGYMSPEQIMGLPLDHRSDIFAASTCLWEMLTCHRLFSGKSDIEVIDKVRQAKAQRPSEMGFAVPPELEEVLMRGLAKSTADRYSTAGEMQEDLMMFIAASRPPFGTAQLGDWMRTAFAPEIAEEKAHLDRLTNVAQPGQKVGRAPAPPKPPTPPAPHELIGFEDDEDEATMMSTVPFDELLAPTLDDKRRKEVDVSVMVVVDEVVARNPAKSPVAAAPAPAVRPLPAPARAGSPYVQPMPASQSPSTAPLPYAPTQPWVQSPQGPAAPAPYVPQVAAGPLAPTSTSSRPPPPVATPHLDPSALAPPPLPREALPSAAPPKKRSRAFGCFLFTTLLGVLVISGLTGFWFTGGDTVLRQRVPQLDAFLDQNAPWLERR